MTGKSSAILRAYRLGAHSRALTIAAWLRTLEDWNVSLDRAAEMIEAGVPWHSSEQIAENENGRIEYERGYGPGDGDGHVIAPAEPTYKFTRRR